MSISTEIERIENAKTAIETAKTAIRTAINAKGGVLTENQPMSEYAVAITALQTGESVDLSFVTATASDILAGKIGADTSGNPVNGTIQTVTASLTDNVVTVPQGFVASEQTLTVAEMSEPSVSRNVVTIAKGYNKSERITTVGTAKGAETITPGTADRTIAAGTYLTGALTVKGDADLVAENIAEGKEIFGISGSFKGGSSMDFYKCAAVHGPYQVQTVIVSGCPTAAVNGEYMPTQFTTSDWEGKTYPVYKNTASNYYYYYETNNWMSWGIGQDYTSNFQYQGQVNNSWYDMDWNTVDGMSAVYGEAWVDTDVPKTWDGYKAVLSGGVYTFEDVLTEGMTYSSIKPKKYGVYSADCMAKLDWLIQDYPTRDLAFHASFTEDLTFCETWQNMTNKKAELATVDGVKCVKFDANQWSKIDVIANPAVYSGSGWDYTFFSKFRVNSSQSGGRLFSIGSTDYSRRVYLKFSEEDGSWKVNVRQGGDSNNVSFVADRDVWNTIVITSTTETKKLIIRLNGAVVAELNAASTIGGDYAGFGYVGDDFASGYLNNVMIYNRALSEAEIAELNDKFAAK